MSDVVIKAEGLGKKYVIGHETRREQYTALRDVLARGASNMLRKASDMLHGRPIIEGDELEEVWALRDVSFEVKRGEVVGIIGANGAGKSTLLKILSRITEPTEGRVTVRGRVASLLEVGTGFHPELTGRENIFLNGALLGLSRREIRARLDEIVAFAEIDRFLDTPVKRYSSGMYVRLAFAVAAHLDPEILVVDEVLAVGDVGFQEKCLGKMKSVAAGEGRTVLFVSHNMAAVTALTRRAIALVEGRLSSTGHTPDVVRAYVERLRPASARGAIRGAGRHSRICAIAMSDADGSLLGCYEPGQPMRMTVDLEADGTPGLSIELMLLDANQQRLGLSSLHQFHGLCLPARAGRYRYEIVLAGLWLAAGRYSFDVVTSVANVAWDHYVERGFEFEVPFSNPEGRGWDFRGDLGFGTLALRAQATPRFVPLDVAHRKAAPER